MSSALDVQLKKIADKLQLIKAPERRPIMSHELLPPINRYVLLQDPFLRFIIVHSVMVFDGQLNTNIVAWSGSRWVPIGGDFQVCNFQSPESAHSYAKEAGLQYGYELSEAARPASAPSGPASGADESQPSTMPSSGVERSDKQ